jgi:hypothetical protein
MVVKPTLDTVVSLAQRAFKVLLILKRESILTAWFRTPLNLLFLFNELIESEFLEFREVLLADTCLNIFNSEVFPTVGISTRYLKLKIGYFSFDVLFQTLTVEHMFAEGKRNNFVILLFEWTVTDSATEFILSFCCVL